MPARMVAGDIGPRAGSGPGPGSGSVENLNSKL